MSLTLASAVAIVRAWTRLYTVRMDPALRNARRAEIDSDLWEFHEDARRRGALPELIAMHMVVRLVLGVGHDLLWRAEHRAERIDYLRQALCAMAAASVALLWLVMSALQTKEPPLSPVGGHNLMRLLYPVHIYPAPLPLAPWPSPAAFVVHVQPAPPPPPPPPEPPWR